MFFQRGPVKRPSAVLLSALLGTASLSAWSPRLHEAQTALALGLVPEGMARFLKAHAASLAAGARGQSADQAPTIEEVEEQFQRVVRLSEQGRNGASIAKELGILAHQVQLLLDPSATGGVTPLREAFEVYGDEHLPHLVVTSEPFWAVTAPLDPRPALVGMYRVKYERHQALAEHYDAEQRRRLGSWDTLSVPFAQLQLSFSAGVNATANLWIQAWRSVGDLWPPVD